MAIIDFNGCLEDRQPIKFEHRIRWITLLKFFSHRLRPRGIADSRQRQGRQHFYVPTRGQRQSSANTLFRSRCIPELRLAQCSVYLPQSGRLLRVGTDGRIYRTPREISRFC